jgi:hypothetical protein
VARLRRWERNFNFIGRRLETTKKKRKVCWILVLYVMVKVGGRMTRWFRKKIAQKGRQYISGPYFDIDYGPKPFLVHKDCKLALLEVTEQAWNKVWWIKILQKSEKIHFRPKLKPLFWANFGNIAEDPKNFPNGKISRVLGPMLWF